MAVYLVLAAALFIVGQEVTVSNVIARLAFRTVLLLVFVAYIVKKDLPLKSIPVINRFIK